MPIDIQCAECKKKFRVAEKFSGRRIKCPICEKPIIVQTTESGEGDASDAESSGKASSSDVGKAVHREPAQRPAATKRTERPEPDTKPTAKPADAELPSDAESPDDADLSDDAEGPEFQPSSEEDGQWYMQTDDGEQYGPVEREELEAWIAEGRIDGSCQLLCDGWDQWRWADEVFPDLGEDASTEDAPMLVAGDSGKGSAVGAASRSDTKLATKPSRGGASTASTAGGVDGLLAETRPWVMLMAIVGFVCAGLGVLGALVSLILSAVSVIIPGILVSLVMLATQALVGWAAFHLFVYAQRIAAYLATAQKPELEQALAAQRSFWRLAGILTLAALGSWVVTGLLVLILALVV
ncbi:MAG: GYF domain-containing protein [Patescibacteria group bacterium]|nr:GYF domain-containing protein [Patescibacteria group bacterium]